MIRSFVYFIILVFSGCALARTQEDSTSVRQRSDSLVTISIAAVGDLMCHSVQFDYARTTPDSFDFNPSFSLVKKIISSADFACGNLETVTAGRVARYSGYPNFNSPDAYVEAIKNAGFDLLFTSNNHALDRGLKGINKTIRLIRKLGLNQTGTFLSKSDRDSIRIFDIKGIKTGFLSYSYGVNSGYIPGNRNYIINIIDTALIKEDISSAREKGADIVVLYFHFGQEYHLKPTRYQKEIVNAAIRDGADIIIASHPHVLEPVRYFKTQGASLDSGFAVYSLGNFISNQRKRYRDGGVILTIKITKDITKDSLYISGINYLPTWVFKGEVSGKREFIIVPDDSAGLSAIKPDISKYEYSKMQQSFEDTRHILNLPRESSRDKGKKE